jgi:protein-L-isoaspartate O-methyltransferase
MGFYSDQILPRATDVIMAAKQLGPIRARVAAGLDGGVLEVGFGSGLNIAYYPSAVHRVRAVDPATLGRKLAAKRLATCPVSVEFAGLDGQHLRRPGPSRSGSPPRAPGSSPATTGARGRWRPTTATPP